MTRPSVSSCPDHEQPNETDASMTAVLVTSRWQRMSIASEIHAAALVELRDFPTEETRALAEVAEELLSVVCNETPARGLPPKG